MWNQGTSQNWESRRMHSRDRTAAPTAPSHSQHSAHSDLGELTCAKCQTFYDAYIVVDQNRLQENTTKQTACKVWRDARKLRITASTAKKVPKTETADHVIKFFSRHLHPKFGRMGNTGHGIDKEAEALAVLQTILGQPIQPSGTVCHAEEPWLSASPDGVFLNHAGEKTVVEVKCPLVVTSLQDKFSENRMVADLEYHEEADPQYSLTKFGYYTQVQLTMYCMGVRKCKYFVFNTPDDYILVDVDFNEVFVQSWVEWLKKFYFKTMLPTIVDEVSHGRLQLCKQYRSLCLK